MRSIREELVEIILDLIRINKRRVSYYKGIIVEGMDLSMELIEIFRNRANENRKYAEELTGLLASVGVDFFEDTVAPGKIFDIWSDTNDTLNGTDQKALLHECERREQATLEAYKTALISDSLNDHSSRKLIMDQKFALQTSVDMIKKYHDLQELVFLTHYNPVLMWNQNLQNIKAG